VHVCALCALLLLHSALGKSLAEALCFDSHCIIRSKPASFSFCALLRPWTSAAVLQRFLALPAPILRIEVISSTSASQD
jgi:hypothetical protein